MGRKAPVENTPASTSMSKPFVGSQISLTTDGVAVAVKQRTRSAPISFAKRLTFRYSARKDGPADSYISQRASPDDQITREAYPTRKRNGSRCSGCTRVSLPDSLSEILCTHSTARSEMSCSPIIWMNISLLRLGSD